MRTKAIQYLLLFIALMGFDLAHTQSSCDYEALLVKGIIRLNAGDPGGARQLFKEARNCPDTQVDLAELSIWEGRTQPRSRNRSVRQIEQDEESCFLRFLGRAIAGYDTSNYFEKTLLEFRAAESCLNQHPNSSSYRTEVLKWTSRLQRKRIKVVEDALAQAKRSREIADSNQVIAQSSRYGLMANNERELQKDTNSMILAYAAKKLKESLDGQVSGDLKRTFSQAVFNYFFIDLNNYASKIYSILPLSTPSGVAIERESGQIDLLYFDRLYEGPHKSVVRHEDYVSNMIYSPEHRSLLTASQDHTSRLYNLETKQSVNLKGHADEVSKVVASFYSDQLLTCSRDSTARLYDLHGNLQAELGHRGRVLDGDFSKKGYILTRSSENQIRIWSPTGEPSGNINLANTLLRSAFFAPEGDRIIVTAFDENIRMFDLSGNLISTITCDARVKIARFLPGTSTLVAQTSGNVVQLWNLQGQLLSTLQHDDNVTSLHLDEANGHIMTSSKDGLVKIWSLDGAPLQTLKHDSPVLSTKISAKGDLILTTSNDGKVRLWDMAGDLLLDQSLDSINPIPATFSADGRYIVLAYNDNSSLKIFLSPEVAYLQTLQEREKLRPKIKSLEKQYNIELEFLWSDVDP